ncbi:MAG: hypothetical protein ACFFDN_16480, partial [Candidatus Hodarchaeota archaeon]
FKNIKIYHQKTDRDLIAPLSFIVRENPDKLLAKYLIKLFIFNLFRKLVIRLIIHILAFLGITSRMTIIAEKSYN